MRRRRRFLPAGVTPTRARLLAWMLIGWLGAAGSAAAAAWSSGPGVAILAYHRFGPRVLDNMTVTTAVFEAQLQQIRAGGYTVIPLRQLVDYLSGRGAAPPARSVVITADDGHETVYTEMFPLIRRYRIPVTLFIYPSAISNARYAMTWDQIRTMQASGLVDVQSHTYWHPNFRQEQRRLSADAYARFVEMQLVRSREVLDSRLGIHADMLAWPFGIHDPHLEQRARNAGYVAGFTLTWGAANRQEDPLILPRYLMTDSDRGSLFARILAGRAGPRAKPPPPAAGPIDPDRRGPFGVMAAAQRGLRP